MINSEQRQIGCDVIMCSVDKIEPYVMMCVYDGGWVFIFMRWIHRPETLFVLLSYCFTLILILYTMDLAFSVENMM